MNEENNINLSVIVPVYNVEKYLDKCVQSLINQTLSELEIILVDDKSPDNCPQMCDEWAQKDTRIKVVHKTQNEGLGMACNTGIEVATGEYVAFCDSDDWVDAEMYETMYNMAAKHQAQAVYTGLKRIDEKGDITLFPHPTETRFYKGRDAVDELMLNIIASEPSDPVERHIAMSAKVVLYSRELIDRYHIRFESERKIISEDLFFNLDNLTHAERVVVLPNRFYYYFCNNQSLTKAVRKDRFEQNLVMRDELKKRYSSYIMHPDFLNRVNRLFIGYARTDVVLLCKYNSISIKERIKLLQMISNHPIWIQLQKEYPISKMPISHRFVFFCIKNKIMLPLFLISWLK